MRRILLFILPILLIVSVIFTVFGIVQVNYVREKLLDDLMRKTRVVAESMEYSVLHVLQKKDLNGANYLAEKFEYRKRLQGCVIYDNDGKIFAVTKRFNGWELKDKPYIKEILADRKPRGEIEKFKEYYVYSYVLPVESNGVFVGLVEIIYDTTYLLSRMTALWKRISITLIILVSSVFVLSLFLHKQIYVLPLQRLADWFTNFQKGETNELNPIKEIGELGKLATEAEQVALSLRIARKAISQQATLIKVSLTRKTNSASLPMITGIY